MCVAGKPKTMCGGAAYEARCRMMWDMEAMRQVGEPLLVGGGVLAYRTHSFINLTVLLES